MESHSARAPLYFLFGTILAQTAAFAALIMLRDYRLVAFGVAPLLALLIAVLLRLPRSWQVINVLLVPCAVLYFVYGLSPSLLLIPLFMTVIIYIPTFWTRIPYYPTSVETYEAVLSELPKEGTFSFIDLGCGFAGLLTYVSDRLPEGRFFGVEISPLPFLISKLRSLFRKNLDIRAQSFWSMPLGEYDVIYAFLAPPPMPRLWEKIRTEHSGSIIINSFPFPTAAHKTVKIGGKRNCELFIYRTKK